MIPTFAPIDDHSQSNDNDIHNDSVAVINVESTPVKPPRTITRDCDNMISKKSKPRETYHDAVIEIKNDDDEDEKDRQYHDQNKRKSLTRQQLINQRRMSVEVECDLNLGGVDYNDNNTKNIVSILPDTNYPRKQSIYASSSNHHNRKDSSKRKDSESSHHHTKDSRSNTLNSNASSTEGHHHERRASFVKRASISIDVMRRKSIERVKHTFSAYKGIVMAMSSAIFFTLTAVIVKYLKDIHPGQMACFRFLGILLFTIPMIITAEVHPFGPKEKRHFLLLRGKCE
jgi:hypothetical protein